jgi:hypothetical protein
MIRGVDRMGYITRCREPKRLLMLANDFGQIVWIALPDLLPSGSEAENGASEQGRAKKQRLINYLRVDRPEELLPVSRKLLDQKRPMRQPYL